MPGFERDAPVAALGAAIRCCECAESGGLPLVAVMESTDFGQLDDLAGGRRLDWPRLW